jgi:WhiB family transcriptional regulator, redox-sensing transcriptional regulator
LSRSVILRGMNKGELFRDWRERAACRGTDPELFFPTRNIGVSDGGSQYQKDINAAKAVCAGCPVRKECLDFADATHQEDGIWGGINFKEKPKARRN